MFQQYLGSRKSKIFALAGLVLLVLLLLAWRFVALQKAVSKVTTEPVLKISYCGAEPEELCILSFGRDAEENMVVNLFVPDRKFPEFYLKIKRVTGESVYECEKDKEVKTSVFCFGDMVNLLEKMEVSLFSLDDDRLMAAGNFTLKAMLVSGSSQGGSVDGLTEEASETSTPTSIAIDGLTATPTSTPDPSYPYP